jgi:hypothetical protein
MQERRKQNAKKASRGQKPPASFDLQLPFANYKCIFSLLLHVAAIETLMYFVGCSNYP